MLYHRSEEMGTHFTDATYWKIITQIGEKKVSFLLSNTTGHKINQEEYKYIKLCNLAMNSTW